MITAIASVLFAPVVTTIVVAIWIDDRGSPFFHQVRIGRHRIPFRILKFRTMRDGKVTRVGRWLRRTGLDELTQFVNVLRGEMTIVGPRPLTQEDIDRLGWVNKAYDWRFATQPGITGLAQLAGGRCSRHSARLDRVYLRKQSATLDIYLIALSFAANIVGKGVVRRQVFRKS